MPEFKQWEHHHGVLLDSVAGFDVVECEPCGFTHVLPIPSPTQLESVYREEYYSVEKPLYLERHREDLDWWNLVYAERYDSFEALLPTHRRRILDVGSGPGFFLLHGTQRGWQTLGVEPAKQAAAHSQELGLDVVDSFLTAELAPQLGTFDVVHMSEVLEHIPDPADLLRIATGLLRPGGLVCVVVPNDYSPFQHALRSVCGCSPWWVAPPHHINYFSVDSLRHLFTANGLDVVLCEATFPIDLFLLMGENYVGDDSIGRACHGKRKLLERNLALAGLGGLKRRVYRDLAAAGIGREVMMIARLAST